jgi:hypothetical protein
MSDVTEITMSVGSTITWSATAGGSYAQLGGITSFKRKKKRGTSDASLLTDTKMRKKPKGRLDLGSLECQMLYGKTAYALMDGWMNAGTMIFLKLNSAEGSSSGPIAAFMSDEELDCPADDPIQSPVTFDLSNEGADTFAPAA